MNLSRKHLKQTRDRAWRTLAAQQLGLLARRQLLLLGIDHHFVDAQGGVVAARGRGGRRDLHR